MALLLVAWTFTSWGFTFYYVLTGTMDSDLVKEFMDEALIMKQFNNANVLSLIGISVHEDKPCVLPSFMSNGNLQSFVTANKSVSNW